MEVLKRKNDPETIEKEPKRSKIEEESIHKQIIRTTPEQIDDSDSEDEQDLLERLFGSKKLASVESSSVPEIDEEVKNDEPTQVSPPDSSEKDECVWEDEDDDLDRKNEAQTKFAEINSGWLSLKRSTEEPFSGKIFSKSRDRLAEKVVDIEECGRLGIKGMGYVSNFQFHHLAPVAVTSQQDTVIIYQIDGKENGKLQSIRLDKFKIAGCSIISDGEVLCTSNTPWFYSYDIINGKITRHSYLRGTRNHKMSRFYTSPSSDFIAFPTALGGISIVSKKNKELVDTLQSGTNSSIDCHMSRDGQRIWNLAENGEVMCFDLRMMKAVNAFQDLFGATSLAVNNSESLFCVGSSSGLINIYDGSCQLADGNLSPLKTLKNLRAPVTLQRFNKTDEIALFASELVAGQTKLYHADSHSIFKNFPGERKIDAVRMADFSPNSGFLGIGNTSVKLFKLNHYKSY